MLKPPNLFLIGAPKSGTSALADLLVSHSDIYAMKKEPRFFDANVFHDDPTRHAYKDLGDYMSLFKSRTAQAARYRLDASVFVMYDAGAIERILKLSPHARFLIVLRDPISACQSMHAQRMKYNETAMREVSEDFCECWQLIQKRRNGKGFPPGCLNRVLFRYDFLYHYEWHLPAALDAIGANPMMAINYRDLIEKREATYEALASFLEIDQVGFSGLRTINASFSGNSKSSASLIKKSIHRLAKTTQPFRSRLGLVGYRLDRLRKFSEGLGRKQQSSRKKVDLQCADALRAEFEPTMAYMNELFGDR